MCVGYSKKFPPEVFIHEIARGWKKSARRVRVVVGCIAVPRIISQKKTTINQLGACGLMCAILISPDNAIMGHFMMTQLHDEIEARQGRGRTQSRANIKISSLA